MVSLGSSLSATPGASDPSNVLDTLRQIQSGGLGGLGGFGGLNSYLNGNGFDGYLGGLGLMGLGNYGSGVDSVSVGKARFQPRRWLMDYGGGNSINSYGLVGTPSNPNNQIRQPPPATPDGGGLMDTPGQFTPNPSLPNYGGLGDLYNGINF